MAEQPWGMWAQLGLNLIAVSFFISVWAHLQYWFAKRLRPLRHVAFGAAMGIAAITTMLLSFRLMPGVFFDFRAPLLAIAGFFGGPLGAIGAVALAGAFRISAGGPGMIAGLMGIGLSATLGAGGYLAFGRAPQTVHVLVLSLAVGAASLLSFLALPAGVLQQELTSILVPIVGLGCLATFVAGLVLLHTKRLAAERILLRAAIAQSPDYQYVKNTQSQFVAVNNQVAHHNGFARPEDMMGATDRDLTSPERSNVLMRQEQALMQSGEKLLDFEEHLTSDGQDQWFLTSKVPVLDEEGEVIGIAGVTRDITTSRKLEQDLVDSRNLLQFAMSEMADGLAMFDRDGYLIYCNERYRSTFPLTARARNEGAHIRDILREVVETGEQVNIPHEATDDWMSQVEASLRVGGEEQVNLYDGRWLQLRTRATETGASMVVVTDVTAFKQSEQQLLSLAGELQKLATIDGLTGLTNRRTFDQALENQLQKTSSGRSALTLLMIDVDHFKSFNDTYGHPAGDECLRLVGKCLKMALRRSDDLVARYGGEEFAVILPATTEDDAFQIAERVRQSLMELAIPHVGNAFGTVTVSIGIASYREAVQARSAPQLIGRADDALYRAKSAGRNRTMGWQDRQQLRA